MVRLNQGLPVRGRSQLIILLCGSPLDGIRSVAFLAKVLACSSLCRLSFGSDIHSRMIFRRSSCSGFLSNPWRWRGLPDCPAVHRLKPMRPKIISPSISSGPRYESPEILAVLSEGGAFSAVALRPLQMDQ